jgi:hypothetical protein
MNAYTIRIVDMLERIVRFFVDHTITPAIARVTTASAEVATIIADLRAAGQKQTTGLGGFSGGVDVREETMRGLRAFLRYVNRTGRMLDTEHPGIRATFRLPRGASNEQMLAAARAIELAATELETEFVAAGLPASFLTELAGLIDAFIAATQQKHDGRILRGGSTAELKAKAARGIELAQQLDTCTRNHFRGNAEALGAWTIARHIELAPRRTAESTPASPTPPSGGEGSGSNTAVAG